jgi:disulfide bond formation protein DsbB
MSLSAQRIQHLFLLTMVLGLGVLLFVYVAEYVFGLKPCYLCRYERIPYALATLIAFLGWLWKPKSLHFPVVLLFLTFFGSIILSGYHVGVEQHFFAPTEACTGGYADAMNAQSIEELQAAILNAPVARCDEVLYTFLGLSMTVYNFLLSLALMLGYGIIFFMVSKKNRVRI